MFDSSVHNFTVRTLSIFQGLCVHCWNTEQFCSTAQISKEIRRHALLGHSENNFELVDEIQLRPLKGGLRSKASIELEGFSIGQQL